ncbi:transcriptional regulator [Aneurinibacillus migulanus]|jgi:DNA-binding response OmpR family regulator|nr:response regulator transcription factor [Aneurinibacillus migulanus]KIV59511.1 transcriptional regulator [Aneurinibacillus migulanus]KPD07548.1 transcriptional regulator [Aneurinibacillus migulanus]MCP1357490.1 response regulator transcription factor [Aneurinibacillus migulanus]MED4731637.1 response regulator transcription factor [Aneurinibacillus migulanus]CEH27993.1 Putative response regulator protein GraR [Aneurinibacillus migulanus]
MLKILIVEDDKTIRDVLRENIEKWGFEGFCEEDFSDVFATFVQYNPDLVLLDINLPFYDGFYWCNKIREVSKVPIVFISSRDTRMDIVMAMNMGGDDFIQKPFYIDVVMAKINAILRRTYSYTNTESNVIEHDGIVLNLQEGNFLCGEEKVELTKNEFKILYILMKSSGNIVSRDKIMRNLWEDESFVDDNTLTVNIARLRKKLKDAGKDDFIKTKKGQGYIIV